MNRLLIISLGTIGILLIAKYSSWQVALGVFSLMWADNIDKAKP
jgi:hypothetical protein